MHDLLCRTLFPYDFREMRSPGKSAEYFSQERHMETYNTMIGRTASVMGVLLTMSGFINHGLFEIMQGNTPTSGLYIEAIGPQQKFWVHGTEGAVTIIPNFLITGIVVFAICLTTLFWSVKYLNGRHGADVFLVLMVMLTLTGGGLGHIVFFIPVWAYATRIRKPLHWWRRKLSLKFMRTLKKIWRPLIVLTSLSWLVVMELGIFGYVPGQSNPDTILNICLSFVLITVILANLTFISAIAYDIEKPSPQTTGAN